MMMNSTEYLQHMVANNLGVVFIKADPSRSRKEIIYLGNGAEQNDMLELHRAIFDDFREASLIRQDGEEDAEGRTFFRLTEDGLALGKLKTE